METTYCLDTNVLIEAWNKHYSMQLCPDYWEVIDRLAKKSRIFCTMEVKREIEKTDDALFKWAGERPYLFRELTQEVFQNIKKIYAGHPDNRRLVDSSKGRSKADPWVIAHAMAENAVVVTKEGYERNKSKRVKIPNVCETMSVPCINEFEFLNEVGIRFSARLK